MDRKKRIYERFVKRPLDFLLALFGLVVLSPVLVIIAIFVRLRLGSPVLFTQDRPGMNEEIFILYKFRTMTDQRDETGALLPDSIRLTNFGRFLRSTSLDELPELWNILMGDMAVVGPRPLLIKYLPLYSPEQRLRHTVKPGLTGLAQVNGRNSITWAEKFNYDTEYVSNISLRGDISIVIKTLLKVLKRQDINSSNDATMEAFNGHN